MVIISFTEMDIKLDTDFLDVYDRVVKDTGFVITRKLKSELSNEESELDLLRAEIATLKSKKENIEDEKTTKLFEKSTVKKFAKSPVIKEAVVKNLSE